MESQSQMNGSMLASFLTGAIISVIEYGNLAAENRKQLAKVLVSAHEKLPINTSAETITDLQTRFKDLL